MKKTENTVFLKLRRRSFDIISFILNSMFVIIIITTIIFLKDSDGD